MRSLPTLTNSAEKTWRDCARKFKLAYVDLVRPIIDAEALQFGTLIHKALEAWWKAAKADPNPACPICTGADDSGFQCQDCGGTGIYRGMWLRAALAAMSDDRDPYRRATCEAMMVGYHHRWQKMVWEGAPYDGCALEVIAVEQEFSGPLINPSTGSASKSFARGGKLDVLVRVRTSERDEECPVWVCEHKCLPASATVFDHNTGRYVTVGELHRTQRAPLLTAMAEDGSFVLAQAKPPVDAGMRAIFRVDTLGGRSLRASGNHPIWTQRGWVAASDLRVGDWVATPKYLSTETTDAPLSDEEIRIIGYMIGDGSLHRMQFTKTDERVLADVVSCAAKAGEDVHISRPVGKAPYISFSQARTGRYALPKAANSGSYVPTDGSGYVGPVLSLMKRAGILDHGSATKRAPLHLGLSDRQLGQLVGALWSTDGCVDVYAPKGKGKKLRIIYTSVSDGLCVDIQSALQRLGIVSNVRRTSVEYKGERRAVSTVQVVSRESKRRFLALVRDGVIPVIRMAASLDEAARSIPITPQGDDSRMQPRMDPAIWWDRVEAVTQEAEEPVFDIEVPDVHTFVADGIVTHNTSSEDFSHGSPYRARLRMDTQVSGYHVGARLLGHSKVAGVLYDVLGKPSFRPKKATPPEQQKWTKTNPPRLYAGQRLTDETPEEYQDRILDEIAAGGWFARFEVVRLAREEEQAARDTWQRAQEIKDAVRLGRFPRNASACSRYGRGCEYLPICLGEATANDGTRYRRAETAHEELGGGREERKAA